MFMGRVLRTILPTKSFLLKPKFPTEITVKRLKDEQSKQKAYYDKTAVKLSPLKTNQLVYLQMGHRDWTPGTVLKKLDTPSSYLVKTSEGSERRRNRIHLRPDQNPSNSPEICHKQITTERPDDMNEIDGEKVECTQQQKQTESPAKRTVPETLSNGASTPKRTESAKRIIRKSARFQDYV
ncbi:hypothetical protein AVEN_50067-1 [Araneus ventricosus]|uniref:Uncharacterized protein n=1 Tax=Araneus ventricosus TaxID=182803 RepID=A0A4Y2G984_ARAVE|nr:hypothetical protein AVEN_50067-1 [Araneus ventricosus]